MELLKQLLSVNQSQPVEEAVDKDAASYKRFLQLTDRIEHDLELMLTLFKNDSNFRKLVEKLVEKLGGEVSLVNDALDAAKKLSNTHADLVMSVGIAQQDQE